MINARQIRKIVEDNVNFDLSVNGRKRKESDARALFYKLCREYTNDTYETIGAGDQINIIEGPFKGLQALYSHTDGQQRAIVLINLLRQQTPTSLANTHIQKTQKTA